MWTEFYDLHSGGSVKEPYQRIYIEASREDAVDIFTRHFGHDPRAIVCDCCGPSYGIVTDEPLDQLTGYARGCVFSTETETYLEIPDEESGYPYQTMEQFLANSDILVLRYEDLTPQEQSHLVAKRL